MKVKALSFLASLCFVFSSPVFSADITITGPDIVTGSGQFTFYATPVVSGATYTWSTGNGTIVAQNTDPSAGPIYVTLDYPPILGQDAVEIRDNYGNSGIHFIEIWGWASIMQQKPFGTNKENFNEGLNSIRATWMYERFEAIGAGENKRAVKRLVVVA